MAISPYGLRNQLHSLKACCDRLQMEVNKDKGGVEIEAANKYHYLGLAFTTLNVKRGTDHLVAKGKNGRHQSMYVFFKNGEK